MATWISHMMIADNLLNRGLYLDKTGFCVGNIAPDCNVENEDWTEFIPPRKVTHWMTGKSKLTADYEAFYKEYIHEKSFISKEAYSFFMGYYVHLITDVLFQKMVREEKRVRNIFERIKKNSELCKQIEGYPEDFDTLKRVFGKEKTFHDISIHEINYLKKNPESAYNTVLRKIDDFPDYMDILPKGAIIRKIKIMAYEPAEESQDEFVFFEPNEYQNFIDRTSDHIYEMLQNKMRVNFVLTGKKTQN